MSIEVTRVRSNKCNPFVLSLSLTSVSGVALHRSFVSIVPSYLIDTKPRPSFTQHTHQRLQVIKK